MKRAYYILVKNDNSTLVDKISNKIRDIKEKNEKGIVYSALDIPKLGKKYLHIVFKDEFIAKPDNKPITEYIEVPQKDQTEVKLYLLEYEYVVDKDYKIPEDILTMIRKRNRDFDIETIPIIKREPLSIIFAPNFIFLVGRTSTCKDFLNNVVKPFWKMEEVPPTIELQERLTIRRLVNTIRSKVNRRYDIERMKIEFMDSVLVYIRKESRRREEGILSDLDKRYHSILGFRVSNFVERASFSFIIDPKSKGNLSFESYALTNNVPKRYREILHLKNRSDYEYVLKKLISLSIVLDEVIRDLMDKEIIDII